MEIIRDQLEESLFEFITNDNGIIIGPPGIGKTFLLKKQCSKFKEQRIPCIYLPIDRFDIENSRDLEELFGYKGDFIKGLANQQEVQKSKGFLIIDSYDSAKSEKSKKFYLNLIRRAITELKNKWQLIVSVRIFDAKKSQTLLELFERSPKETKTQYQNSEILCRHFLIPKLTDIELRETLNITLGPSGNSLNPGTEIWDLLKTPFNFWIFEQILSNDNSVSEIQKFHSQVELLDFYWNIRVHDSQLWEDKEIILQNATQRMVESKKLFVKIEDIYTSDKKEAWEKLLSDQILVETIESNQKFSYSHNILFDYAVSILLLKESENTIFSFISEDLSRQLFLRPSLDFYFTRLWYSNPTLYWKIFWKILRSSQISLNILIRLTSINVLINEIKTINDLIPIFSELKRGDPQGINATLYVLQSLELQDLKDGKIWLEFLENLCVYQDDHFVWNFAWLLSKIIDDAKNNKNIENLHHSGKIGRSLLTWVLEERKKKKSDIIDGLGSSWAVPIVAKTFNTDPKLSVVLLKEVLAIREESNFPIMYIYRLVDELENIWPSDPEFAELVYLTVLIYEETSQEKTPMGTPVLPLSSTRRQDYEMCYFLLAKNYPKFLLDNPLAAAKAAIVSLNQYIIKNHIIPFINPGYNLDNTREKYVLKNKPVSVYSDHCIMWDTSGYIEEPIKIANELFNYIERRAEQKDVEFIEKVINIFIENVKVPFFWRRLLISATKYPDVFAEKLFDFCITEPMLSGPETIKEMGDFLQKSSLIFSSEQLLKIEKTILEIPKVSDKNNDECRSLERKRNRLLSRIPKDLLQTEEGIAIRSSMEKSHKIPDNEPLVKWEGGVREYSEKEFLTDHGVDFSQDPNKELFQLFDPLKEFSSKWLNERPNNESIQEILPILKEFYAILEKQTSADLKIKDRAWTYLASCISEICEGIEPSDKSTFNFSKEVLLKCAHHPEPVFDPKYHSTFDSPAWSPDPRTEAAVGLPRLAGIIPEKELLKEIRNLAIIDNVPAVRYLTVSHLLSMWKTDPDFVWDLSIEIIEKEQIPTILFSVCRNIGTIFFADENNGKKLLGLIFDSTILMKFPDRSNPFIPSIVQLAVKYQNVWAKELLTKKIIKNPETYSKHFGFIVFELSRIFDPKFSENIQKYDEICGQAIEILDKLVDATQLRMLELIPTIDKTKEELDGSELNDLYLVIHEVVIRIYFATEKKDSKTNINKIQSPDKRRKILYLQLKPILEKIIKFANSEDTLLFNARTLHYFVKIFNAIIEFDPEFTIRTFADLLKRGDSRFLLDPLATSEMIKFGKIVIGDYRDALQDEGVLKDFVAIVDTFAKNGNKEMMQFVWRLDEIYRN
jgi:hypothetical protein